MHTILLSNLLIENHITTYLYIKEKNLFEPQYNCSINISEMILLTQKLKELSIDFEVGSSYEIKVTF